VVQRAVQRDVPLLIINRDPSVFSEMAVQSTSGHFIEGSAAEALPTVVDVILARSNGDIHA
jgi:hypothetical protein